MRQVYSSALASGVIGLRTIARPRFFPYTHLNILDCQQGSC